MGAEADRYDGTIGIRAQLLFEIGPPRRPPSDRIVLGAFDVVSAVLHGRAHVDQARGCIARELVTQGGGIEFRHATERQPQGDSRETHKALVI